MMPVNQRAPVVEAARVEVAAGMEAVWQVLTAIERWPEWNPDIREARLQGPLAEGTSFSWRLGRIVVTSTLLEVESPRFLAWRGAMLGIKGVHVWRLDRTGGGTMVTTEESWDGLLPWLVRGRSRHMLRKGLGSWLDHLKKRLEEGAVS